MVAFYIRYFSHWGDKQNQLKVRQVYSGSWFWELQFVISVLGGV